MNELADEQAELGRMTEHDICPGPQKYGSFWLRVRPAVRELAESSGKPLPRDSAPNHSLLEKMAASNTLRAVKHCSTVFVTDLLQRKEGATVSKVIRMCLPQIQRGAHISTQQSSCCDHLIPEFHHRSQLDNFQGDSDVEDRLENLLDPPGHSREMGPATARLGPGVAAS